MVHNGSSCFTPVCSSIDALPYEILALIIDQVLADIAQDNTAPWVDTIYLWNRNVSFCSRGWSTGVKINFATILILLKVNHTFRRVVLDRIFSCLYFMPYDVYRQTNYATFPTDDSPYVFDSTQPSSAFQVIAECYASNLKMNERIFPHIQKLWLNGFNGTNPIEGMHLFDVLMRGEIRNLTSLRVDMELFVRLTAVSRPLSLLQQITHFVGNSSSSDQIDYLTNLERLEIVGDGSIPPFIIEFLALGNPNCWLQHSQLYKQQFLYRSLAKLIALQTTSVSVTVYDSNTSFINLASLIWAFEQEKILDSLKGLYITAKAHLLTSRYRLPSAIFADQLRKLNKLAVFSHHDSTDAVGMNSTAITVFTPIGKTIQHLHFLKEVIINFSTPRPYILTLPNGIQRLHTDNQFLFSETIAGFHGKLDHIVELRITMARSTEVPLSNDFHVLHMKSLKTLAIEGDYMDDLEMVKIFLSQNKHITAFSTDMVQQKNSVFNTLLLHLPLVECFRLNPTPSLQSQPFFHVPSSVALIFQNLKQLKVLSVTMPFEHILYMLGEIVHKYSFDTPHLKLIYIYYQGSDVTKTTFVEIVDVDTAIKLPGGVLASQFISHERIIPGSTCGKEDTFLNDRLILNVMKARKLLSSFLLPNPR